MDGTLITNTNSVKYLCELAGREDEVKGIEKLEDDGRLNWIDADYEKVRFFKGLPVKKLDEYFDQRVDFINHIEETLIELKQAGIKSIIVTAGPVQVAQLLQARFDFIKVYGSEYVVEEGIFTGNILKHMRDDGKVLCLESFCKEYNIQLEECVAVGDSESDVRAFEKCGKAIAINYGPSLEGEADVYLRTDSLSDILVHIL